MDSGRPVVEFDRVRTSETTPLRCRYCERPFSTPDRLTLHRGRAHPGRLTGAEWVAFNEARASEREALRRYRIRVLFALVAVYFGFLCAYALFA